MDLLKWTAEAWGWLEDQWVVQLLLLLSDEAQLMAQQLLTTKRLEYPDPKWAVLQWVGHTPEQHWRRF